MELYGVKTRVMKAGEDLLDLILESLREQGLQLEDNDVLVLTSKIVAYAENRVINLKKVRPSGKANKLAQQFSMQPEFAELVLREADRIYGGVAMAILTLKNGILAANAGMDNKNAPVEHVVLWPRDPVKWVEKIRRGINVRTGTKVAVMIIDSGLVPLRVGTVGLTMAVAGFRPIRDNRAEKDLFGKIVVMTRHAVADDLASAAHLLMGETTEKTPIVVVRDAPVDFDDVVYGPEAMMISQDECIFMNALKSTVFS